MIVNWILTVLTFTMGFVLGALYRNPENQREIKKRIRKLRKKDLGAIDRPTAESIKMRGTVEEKTEKAMEDTLEEIL